MQVQWSGMFYTIVKVIATNFFSSIFDGSLRKLSRQLSYGLITPETTTIES